MTLPVHTAFSKTWNRYRTAPQLAVQQAMGVPQTRGASEYGWLSHVNTARVQGNSCPCSLRVYADVCLCLRSRLSRNSAFITSLALRLPEKYLLCAMCNSVCANGIWFQYKTYNKSRHRKYAMCNDIPPPKKNNNNKQKQAGGPIFTYEVPPTSRRKVRSARRSTRPASSALPRSGPPGPHGRKRLNPSMRLMPMQGQKGWLTKSTSIGVLVEK